MNPAMWRRTFTVDEQREALRVAADVLSTRQPCHQAECRVWLAPNWLEAHAEWRWPGVVKVTLRHTGELLAESVPGRPNELCVSAGSCGENATFSAGANLLSSASIKRAAEQAWARSVVAGELLQAKLNALRAKIWEEPQDPDMDAILASVDCAVAESAGAAREAITLLAAQAGGLD